MQDIPWGTCEHKHRELCSSPQFRLKLNTVVSADLHHILMTVLERDSQQTPPSRPPKLLGIGSLEHQF